ncbi:hypothetical protein LY76DRAFT_630804 [Colletotrichum caudatum]|nr:hypothetical protein LY76DRAFT_630804 [Colletotrichum caudatum]
MLRSCENVKQIALLQPKDAISRMVTNMIQEFTNMGTLGLFRDGMPTLQNIASKAIETEKLPNAWLYQAAIALGHSYHPATNVKPEKSNQTGPSLSGNVSRPLSDISKKLTKTENPQRPALCPNFGPNAISDLIHGLNFSSPLMETFHTEASIRNRALTSDRHLEASLENRIRIEYADKEGNIKTRYLKCNADPAMSLLATFIYQWKGNPGGVPTSLIDVWPVKLRALEYDFFQQKFLAIIPKKEDMPRPKLLSPNEKAALM